MSRSEPVLLGDVQLSIRLLRVPVAEHLQRAAGLSQRLGLEGRHDDPAAFGAGIRQPAAVGAVEGAAAAVR